MKKILILALLFITTGIIIGYFISNPSQKEKATITRPTPAEEISRKNCIGDDCLIDELNFPIQELPQNIKDTLLKGLDDEYKAYATYQAVMEKHGNIRPFIMIARAEQQHITSLQGLFEKYGIQIPENPYAGKIVAPESIKSACATGVSAEIENVALYKEKLLPLVTGYPDITQVYTNLMNASEQKHLPAFMKCY